MFKQLTENVASSGNFGIQRTLIFKDVYNKRRENSGINEKPEWSMQMSVI